MSRSATRNLKPLTNSTGTLEPFIKPTVQQKMNTGSESSPINNEENQVQTKADSFGRPNLIQPSSIVQARLKMGKSNDPYEKEADQMADQVAKSPNSNAKKSNIQQASEPAQSVQKATMEGEPLQKGESFEKNLDLSKGKGTPMDDSTKDSMENEFGRGFSDVRIHTDANAVQMNNDIGAKAFTNGNDIYFNEGNYDPKSQKGKHLLAHELTHTVQQGSAGSPGKNSSNAPVSTTVQRSPQDKAEEFDFTDPKGMSNQDLVDRLFKLRQYYVQIIQGYYEKEGTTSLTFSLNGATTRYNYVFKTGDQSVTVEMAKEFLKRIEYAGIDTFKQSLPSYYQEDVDLIVSLLNNNAETVSKIESDGKAFIQRLTEHNQLQEYNQQAGELNTFIALLEQRIASRDITQSDVDIVNEAIRIINDSKAIYEASNDPVIKDYYKDVIESYSSALPTYEEFIADSPKYLKQSEKKRTSKEGDAAMNQPTLSEQGGSYMNKGKREGKEDKPNQDLLKFKGLYDKKNDEYIIYEQGRNDADEVDMNDVVQGALGDCYLISSIASVAKQNPAHIKSLIDYTPGDSSATVTLYIMNQDTLVREPKEIVIDFYFPFTGLMESYAKKGDGELWVMLLEKAYAKEMGGYDNIVSGSPAEALAVITGNESEEVPSSSEQTADDFKTATSDGNVGIVASKDEDEVNAMNDPNYKAKLKEGTESTYTVVVGKGEEIVCGHAYSVLKVDEADGTIHLRNPHGGDGSEFAISFADYKACFNNLYYSKVPE
ncbi:MAG: DUF4157 domain-containing protein [bacterium]|nr:DUF4157 domain-containing protein [bacterium]